MHNTRMIFACCSSLCIACIFASSCSQTLSHTWQVETDPDDRDAETRVAAVRALAAVAQQLYNPASSGADPGTHPSSHGQVADDSAAADSACNESAAGGLAADPAAAALVRQHVMGALLVAVEDYSTDNR